MSAACLFSASAVASTVVDVAIRRTSGLVAGTGGVHFHLQPLIFPQKAAFVAVSHWTAMPLQVFVANENAQPGWLLQNGCEYTAQKFALPVQREALTLLSSTRSSAALVSVRDESSRLAGTSRRADSACVIDVASKSAIAMHRTAGLLGVLGFMDVDASESETSHAEDLGWRNPWQGHRRT
jgi:hypothetical protein